MAAILEPCSLNSPLQSLVHTSIVVVTEQILESSILGFVPFRSKVSVDKLLPSLCLSFLLCKIRVRTVPTLVLGSMYCVNGNYYLSFCLTELSEGGSTTHAVTGHDRLSVETVEGPQVWPDFMTSRCNYMKSTYMKEHGNAMCLLGAKSTQGVGQRVRV